MRTGYDLRQGAAMIRDRIAAATGPCVGFDRDLHMDLVAERVAHVRRQTRLHDHLTSRAAALASADGTRRLQVKGA